MSATQVPFPENPLRAKCISSVLSSTGEWVARWKEEMGKSSPPDAALIGLLHFAFRNFVSENIVTICLSVADGHRQSKLGSEEHILLSISNSFRRYQPSQEVAQKAWQVLCTNIFKSDGWRRIFTIELPFRQLLWFFDPKRGSGNLDDHSNDSYSQLEAEFLSKFVRFVWDFAYAKHHEWRDEKKNPAWAKSVKEMFDQSWAEILEIAWAAGELTFLLDRLDTVSDRVLAKLERIALTGLGKFPKRFMTLEAAANANIQAAHVLIILRVKLREAERQAQIQAARMAEEQAERRGREVEIARQRVAEAQHELDSLSSEQ
ncbi:MAG: hypothetical protein UY26_C0003G0283 [Candidatus Jorgensenbacteria bacterium GW2011_GWA1_48_13]|uniref:Uncharacterized protein n=2 Tax=Candidatus Joergenseniibacteriota TaxID=1752739 RepID=A0A0G1Z7B7_9BACT|nr:MAG: hypothetical protein UY26_C0003G0283 [Candidatus Jorgensenbacteria bacterium GW2011_GWA1_48_13]KKU97835.1 MAG: hypothetical protein UY32_C0039G0006 [Candidatus Jorgensenbacteria bacterium GW2011_GWC1_48_8]KKW14829.1 MAG: hypothetical protein UY55_C0003G0045 [Candidatus Jorgensenbacteria bacterium GW2011_GWB1_50_10]